MDVLFLAGGNSKNFEMPPFIAAQGADVEANGVRVHYLPIRGKGILGYLSGVRELRQLARDSKIDLIHAHYTLSGWVAVLAFTGTPIVLSLMGTDAYGEYIGEGRKKFGSQYLTLLTIIIQPFVKAIISKSANIEKYVWRKSISSILPNGINLTKFPLAKREKVGLEKRKRRVLFLGNPDDSRKNFKLVREGVSLIQNYQLEILTPFPIPHEEVVDFLHMTDLLVVPSFMEGSPNLVKEAMACNCPTIATRVGDVEWLFGDTPGYFLTTFNPVDCANQIERALQFQESGGFANGRDRLRALGLESSVVSENLVSLYRESLRQ